MDTWGGKKDTRIPVIADFGHVAGEKFDKKLYLDYLSSTFSLYLTTVYQAVDTKPFCF